MRFCPGVQTADHPFCHQSFQGLIHGLHARRLAFQHPVARKRIDLEAPLPPDLERVLTLLRTA